MAEKTHEEAARDARGAHGSAEATADKLAAAEDTVRALNAKLTDTERTRDEATRRLRLVEADLEKAEDRAVRAGSGPLAVARRLTPAPGPPFVVVFCRTRPMRRPRRWRRR